MKKTILQYMTDIYQEDIPKHILQENKIRLNSFFLEQESVQKKGTQFIFRYAFYSVEKPRKITKQRKHSANPVFPPLKVLLSFA